MTYRLLLWFDMLEEEGRSTTIRGLFSRMPPLSKGFTDGNRRRMDGDGIGGFGSGKGNGYGGISGDGYGSGLIDIYPEILTVKI